MTQTVLVTGGAGFIGSAVARGLREEGFRVTAFDNLRRRGAELNIPELRHHGVEFIHGDVRSASDLKSCGGFDLLVDCSAEPAVGAGQGDGARYVLETNLGGTMNCLERVRECGAGMIFLSTSRVYPHDVLCDIPYDITETRMEPSPRHGLTGLSAEGISEAFPLKGVRSIYGATKLASELLLAEYGETFGVSFAINRCGVVAGPGQYGKSDQGFVTLWIARHEFGRNLAYIGYEGSGRQVRDILHVRDLVDLLLLQVGSFDSIRGGTFNVGGGPENAVSLVELTSLCEEITGSTIHIAPVPEPRAADIPWYVTDQAKIRECLSWTPRRGVSEILNDTLAWIRAGGSGLRRILDGQPHDS